MSSVIAVQRNRSAQLGHSSSQEYFHNENGKYNGILNIYSFVLGICLMIRMQIQQRGEIAKMEGVKIIVHVMSLIIYI